jgi:pimeloyl-ACP methyl ester carboxylesterase
MLLLHGLAGYAGEWVRSAELLCREYRVFALDQRAHGSSTRRPKDMSRDAFVAD